MNQSELGRDAADPIALMRAEFRRRLQTFYAELHLAAPYDSVEQALAHLTRSLKALSEDERVALAKEPARRFTRYTMVFRECGLAQKHRGIIVGLLRSGQVKLPPDYRDWLACFTERPKTADP